MFRSRVIVSIIGQAYHRSPWQIDGFTLELVPELLTELPTVANGGVVINEDGTGLEQITCHLVDRDSSRSDSLHRRFRICDSGLKPVLNSPVVQHCIQRRSGRSVDCLRPHQLIYV